MLQLTLKGYELDKQTQEAQESNNWSSDYTQPASTCVRKDGDI